jgi:hypothetical protein
MSRLHCADRNEHARIADAMAEVLRQESAVTFAFLYGSFVESHAFHDVDVGVYLRDGKSAADVASTLTRCLSDRAGVPVDVRVMNGAPVPFLYHVLRGQLVLSRDDALLGEIMERTVSRYLDIEPLLRRSAKEAFVG